MHNACIRDTTAAVVNERGEQRRQFFYPGSNFFAHKHVDEPCAGNT